jgi:hypothetical protein
MNEILLNSLSLLCFFSGGYYVIGHWVLYSILRRRGAHVSLWLRTFPLYPQAIYFWHAKDIRTRRLDFFVLSLCGAFLITILVFAILVPVLRQQSAP